ncbi:hypothetical protein FQN54_004525 [Arachnomyces sp. PD_36]|nr:hypothetical protein FQN54_004525 [Arachnomyces sp. PD_36]
MALSRSQKRALFRSSLFLFAATIIVYILWPVSSTQESVPREPKEFERPLDAIRNETLGVQAVFAINLPSRTDKQDALVLGSSVSNFRVEFIDGISPDEIDPKTYPYNWNHNHKAKEYAARRAHVDGMLRIVHERLATAIIMEDDADWDVTIKTQLQSFAVAVRALQGIGLTTATNSPYGDHWDILWLGHCGIECRTDRASFLTPNDPTILPAHRFLPYWRDPPPIDRPEHARLTCFASDGVCTFVYAVSYRGAQKILSALSVNPSEIADKIDIGAQFDVSLGRMCKIGYIRCFAPYPSLTGNYQPAGPMAKSSDIHGRDGIREKTTSLGVMYSTMLNINRILHGDRIVHSHWDDAEMPNVNPDRISVMGGKVQMPGKLSVRVV